MPRARKWSSTPAPPPPPPPPGSWPQLPPAPGSVPQSIDPAIQESIHRYNAGVGALQRRDLESALYQFRQAIRLNPTLTEAHHNLGIALLEAHQPAQAAEAFTRALELSPDHLEARLGLGLAHRARGGAARGRGH